MKKLFSLALLAALATATAACDAGIASSSTVKPADGSAPAMCPTMKGGADAGCPSGGGSCGECVEPAAPACEKKGACEGAPMDCEQPCDESMKECKKECEPKVGE